MLHKFNVMYYQSTLILTVISTWEWVLKKIHVLTDNINKIGLLFPFFKDLFFANCKMFAVHHGESQYLYEHASGKKICYLYIHMYISFFQRFIFTNCKIFAVHYGHSWFLYELAFIKNVISFSIIYVTTYARIIKTVATMKSKLCKTNVVCPFHAYFLIQGEIRQNMN